MLLQPIQFNTAQDITNFLNHLVEIKAIQLNDDKTPHILFIDKNCLLKDKNGMLYLSETVKNYVNNHSIEELNNSTITFLNKDGVTVSLSAIKNDPDLMTTLFSFIDMDYISGWNLNWYSELQVPPLRTGEQIDKAKKIYDNRQLHKSISTSNYLLSDIPSMAKLAKNSLLALNPNNLISKMQKDFLRITLLQENKMKKHLINEKTKLTNENDIKKIDEWIQELDNNRLETKELLESVLSIAKITRKKITKTQVIINSMREANLPIEDKSNEFQQANKKRSDLFESISNWEKFFTVLAPTLLWTGIVLTLAIPFAALIVSMLFAPPFFSLIVPLLFIVGGFTVILFNEEIGEAISSIDNALKTKLDSLLDNKLAELSELENQCNKLTSDNFLYQYHNNNQENLLTKYDDLIMGLESDIAELNEPPQPASTVFVRKNASTTGKASNVSLFKPVLSTIDENSLELKEEAKCSM